jgi:hypothetical protein
MHQDVDFSLLYEWITKKINNKSLVREMLLDKYTVSSPAFSDSDVTDPVCNDQALKFHIFVFTLEKLFNILALSFH